MTPFGDYLPDQAPLLGTGATVAHNVVPQTGGTYGPFPELVEVHPDALDGRVLGATLVNDRNQTDLVYAGTAANLYRRINTTHTQKSKAGGYSLSPGERWEFALFGDTLIATSRTTRIQYANVETDTDFADHPTDIQATNCAAVLDFLVVGDPFTTGEGRRPYRVQWSAINDPLDLTPNPTVTQAGFQDLNSNWGPIKRVLGADFYGLILQARCVQRMDYEGPGVIFRFSESVKNTGPLSAGCVAQYSDSAYYLGEEGFVRVDAGLSLAAIGEGRTDRTVLQDLNRSRVGEISALVIPESQIVVWSYPSNDAPSTGCDKILAYNLVADRWASGSELVEILHESTAIAVDMDQWTPANGWTDLDSLVDLNMDTETLDPRGRVLGAYTTNHRAANFAGPAKTAILETAEVSLGDERRFMTTRLRPIVDGGTSSIEIGWRDQQSDVVVYTAPSLQRDSGTCPVRKNARYQRARVTISGGFRQALGIADLTGAQTGWR